MAERTPGEWEVSGPYVRLADPSKAIVAHVLTLHGDQDANAEFIVRAANAHDALVEAAQNALAWLYDDNPMAEPVHITGDLRAALAAAMEAGS